MRYVKCQGKCRTIGWGGFGMQWEKKGKRVMLFKYRGWGRGIGQSTGGWTKSRRTWSRTREQTQDRAVWRRLVQYIYPSRSGIRRGRGSRLPAATPVAVLSWLSAFVARHAISIPVYIRRLYRCMHNNNWRIIRVSFTADALVCACARYSILCHVVVLYWMRNVVVVYSDKS